MPWFLRPRRLGPWADAIPAALLVVLGQWQVWSDWNAGGVGTPPHDHLVPRAFLVTLFAAPLAWRRRRALAVAAVICASIAAQLVLVVAYVPFLVGLVPMMVANYSAAAYARRWRLAGLALVLATEAVMYATVPEERVGSEVLFAVFVALGTWVVGDVVRVRSHRAQQILNGAQVLVTRNQAATAAALADERARIARELHDVIAHSVSVMGIQAGAARTLIDRDPAAARAALLQVESTARSSVGELQRLLAVLRADQQTAADRLPQPALAQLGDLVAQMRSAGLEVSLHVEGGLHLSPGLDLTAFRIVQEALTNALKHAGTPTRASVRQSDDVVDIEVVNVGPPVDNGGGCAGPAATVGGAGHGLIGMRERAQLYGGTLETHPQPDGGFLVHAVLPANRTPSLDRLP